MKCPCDTLALARRKSPARRKVPGTKEGPQESHWHEENQKIPGMKEIKASYSWGNTLLRFRMHGRRDKSSELGLQGSQYASSGETRSEDLVEAAVVEDTSLLFSLLAVQFSWFSFCLVICQ